MDKHNSQQKNKNKNTKKPASPKVIVPVAQEQSAAKEDGTALQGKRSNPSTSKEKA